MNKSTIAIIVSILIAGALIAGALVFVGMQNNKAEDIVIPEEPGITVNNMKKWAKDLGLDTETFNTCLDNRTYQDEVAKDQEDGLTANVQGTPSFFIGDIFLGGAYPYEAFEAVIEMQLSGTVDAAKLEEIGAVQVENAPTVDDDAVSGSADAPVTIIEFSDYQCPFCIRHFQSTYPLLKKNYMDTGKVKYVFRDFPLTQMHPMALDSAIAAECAGDQNMYYEMHDILFSKN